MITSLTVGNCVLVSDEYKILPSRKGFLEFDLVGIQAFQPPSWATAARPILPPNAPTAGYLCGGAGIMSVGFEMAGIRSAWNIDRDPSDPKLSNAIADIAPAIALPTPTGTQVGWLSAVSDLLKDAETVHPTEKQLTKIQRLCASSLDEPLLIERVAPWQLPNVKSPVTPCWTIRKSMSRTHLQPIGYDGSL